MKHFDAENDKANTWSGFWLLIFFTSLIAASWGTPDLIDAFIYYLSDGYYK
jgi:hypothetical protein